jgi:hypothetical protein
MDKRKIVVGGIVLALHVVAAASTASADECITPLAPLFANVNTSYAGAEVIMPYLQQNDSNRDGHYESLTFYYNVYRNNTNTKLYSSTAKTGWYPTVTCATPRWWDTYTRPQFLRSGKWVVTGHGLTMECENSTGSGESHTTFVYVADVSKAGGTVNTLTVNRARLEAVELVDYNSDGTNELMVSMHPEGSVVHQLRIVIKNLTTWATVSDRIYNVSNVRD